MNLLRKLGNLNKEAVVGYLERRRFYSEVAKQGFCWNQIQKTILNESEPVFVLSTGRCGTKLLTKALGYRHKVLCHHSPDPELLLSGKMAYDHGGEFFERYKDVILASRFELMMDTYCRNRRYIETNYRCTFFAPHLYELFPKSKFIHIVRNPINFIQSGVRLKYYEGLSTDIGRIVPNKGRAATNWSAMDSYERMAWLWNETNLSISNFYCGKDQGRLLRIKAEDLFSGKEAFSNIFSFCGLPELSRKDMLRLQRKPVNVKKTTSHPPPYELWGDKKKKSIATLIPIAKQFGYVLG